MKLYALLPVALAAVAAAVPAPRPDGSPKVVGAALQGAVVAEALGKNMLDFEWSTTEYCGDDGALRASGKFHVNGADIDFEFDGSKGEYNFVEIDKKNLHMVYNFDKYVTYFWYGACNWGPLTANCGMCRPHVREGGKPECKDGEKKKNKRYRQDVCHLQVDGDVPPPPKHVRDKPVVTTRSRDLVALSEPDNVLISPSTHGETQDQATYEFTWSTKEYCNEGHLRAVATLTVNDNPSKHIIEPGYVVSLMVGNKQLSMQYKFEGYYTAFEYGDCKWGEHDPSCGSCTLESKEGNKLDCWLGHDVPGIRYRSDKCRMKVDGSVARTPAQLETGKGAVNHRAVRHLTSKSDDTTTLPTAQNLGAVEPVAQDTNAHIGYRTMLFSITEKCLAELGTPLFAAAYIWEPGSPIPGYKHEFKNDEAVSISLGYPGVGLIVGPYNYFTSVLSFHYGGCHWDQDIRGVGDCGFCKSSPWTPSDLNCAMNPSAARTHVIECTIGVEWNAADSTVGPMIAARDEHTEGINSFKRNDDRTAEHMDSTRTEVPEVTAVQNTENTETTILAFHYTLTEYCSNGKLEAWGTYSNGGLFRNTNLPRGLINAVDHLVRPYPPLFIGGYRYDTHHVRFAYKDGSIDCEWFDNEKDKKCGECRAAEWTGPELDCSLGGLHDRTKDMGCSFILGVSQ